MLFNDKEYRLCLCCAHAVDCGEEMFCRKKGPVPKDSVCRAFRYDPLKRQPPRKQSADFSGFDSEDFTL